MFRIAQIKDFNFVYYLYMHPTSNPHLLYEPMTEEEFYPIFKDLVSQNILYLFQMDGKDVGMFKLIPYTYRSGHIAYIGSVAIDAIHAGKGYGMQMMQTIINIAKERKLVRLELSVGEQNVRARELYKRMGFKEEGVLEKYTYLKKENTYINEVLMALIIA